ncbi:hypothetical protein C8N40_110136 [Pontibacter mucosus]|uniref:V-SNARE coiled-coil homology domain-containing protein n=1 Tax=Pontibacter mucosus TaxID=1649266 RepID=A0A2T5YDT9_9BACT|nr:hypothetical protein C8N40_110136 [Pontibacter mucosus]
MLDWGNNFQMVTIDDYAVRQNNTVISYAGPVSRLKNEFGELGDQADMRTLHLNFDNDRDSLWPLTKFEVPYKMLLAPIAEPVYEEATQEFSRKYGAHEFLKKDNNIIIEHISNYGRTSIVRPWQNQLVFRSFDNEVMDPRFKVVHWFCQRSIDNDTVAELIPAPIHREELHDLTMRPEWDRDVFSKLFKISALGSTAILKYKNDNPLEYATVAWEQEIKYARDNYVSITFRAVDVFTGIKLLISIVAEREYEFGISFLPKLYYVTYAEKEKNYTDSVTISKVPFVKIIPQSTGAFFEPHGVNETFNKAYHVAKANPYTAPAGNLIFDNLLTFDYIGIDKDGKEHPFQAKIIFIPAESYQITGGTYSYSPRSGQSKDYPANAIVDINHIGLLNPSRQEKYQGAPRTIPCQGSTSDTYWYRLIKTFDKPQEAALTQTLNAVRQHVMHAAHKPCYTLSINAELTYARLNGLKQDRKTVTASGGTENISPLRKDAANATFNTKDLIILCDINRKLYVDGRDAADNFLEYHPLMAYLEESNVIISQLDQIEGSQHYRPVKYATSYFVAELDIDQDDPGNRAKLLFQLVNPISDFFSKNFRSAGAMVNPGIVISHISVLEQSIAYNETHNAPAVGAVASMGSADLPSMVSSASIFRNLNAEILGIPLKAIVEEFIPVEDLPVFNYLKQAEESIQKIKNLAVQYQTTIGQWIDEYQKIKEELARYLNEFNSLGLKINSIANNPVRAWFESMIRQSSTLNYYRSQVASLRQLTPKYNDYKNQVLKSIDDYASTKYGLKAADVTALLQSPNLTLLESLLKKAKEIEEKTKNQESYSPRLFKEAVKYSGIIELVRMPKLNNAFLDLLEMKPAIANQYQDYFKAFAEGYQEAIVFADAILEQEANRVSQQIKDARNHLAIELKDALDQSYHKFFGEHLTWVLKAYEIAETYKYYYDQYHNLHREDYRTLAQERRIAIAETSINELEGMLVNVLKIKLQGIYIPSFSNANAALQRNLTDLKRDVIATLETQDNNLFRNYEEHYNKLLRDRVQKSLKEYTDLLAIIDRNYEEVLKEYQRLRELIDKRENLIRSFVQNKIEEAKKDLERLKSELITKDKGSAEYQVVMEKVGAIQSVIQKVQDLSYQKLEYQYNTRRFRQVAIGNVVEFIPRNAELKVNVVYSMELNVHDLDRPPSIARQSFLTESTLTNFKLGVLQLLYIDFLEVRFITGSDTKDDFKVRIRDVQFAGCLSFVEAFQDYLRSLDNNLVFDINASGAQIGYGLSIPDFTAGYFNFFNFNLSALITLPFDPKQSLQLQFGFGSPLNKFGLTISGIFGGQGYFNLIAETRRGIVGIEIVLEFGAIFQLNLVVASGTAYLVGGIYIRRYESRYLIKAYILAVGRFNVLGLFSASMSFYLGMEGDGNVLEGECTIRVSKRFTRFFEISVNCTMRKTIKGTRRESRNEPVLVAASEQAQLAAAGLTVLDTNLTHKQFYSDEYLYVVLTGPAPSSLKQTITGPGISSQQVLSTNSFKKVGNELIMPIRKTLNELKQEGQYEFSISYNDTMVLSRSFFLMSNIGTYCGGKEPSTVNDYEYYASYYQ